MNIVEALEVRTAEIEVELAASLPVCSGEKEYVFFYGTKTINEESFKVDRIFYVYQFDQKSGELKRLAPEEIIPQELLAEVAGCVIIPKVFDEEAMDMEDQYYENYKKTVAAGGSSGEGDASVEENRVLFQKLVPESALRQVYRHLAGNNS